ncbi:MAG: hypothetical protein ACFFCW_08185 [Candidatus Hodarchaeota archaeon]
MKIICMECHREIGEKFPFDDLSETHTICRECIERRLIEIRKKGLRGKFVKKVIRVPGS